MEVNTSKQSGMPYFVSSHLSAATKASMLGSVFDPAFYSQGGRAQVESRVEPTSGLVYSSSWSKESVALAVIERLAVRFDPIIGRDFYFEATDATVVRVVSYRCRNVVRAYSGLLRRRSREQATATRTRRVFG